LRRYFWQILVILSAVPLAACAPDEPKGPTANVYFLPFEIATAVPVTRDAIERIMSFYGEPVRQSARFRELERLVLRGRPCNFFENVRAKIVLPSGEGVMFINDAGCAEVILGTKTSTYQLTDAGLAEARRLLLSMTKCVESGCG
jgi:hypothetical protein